MKNVRHCDKHSRYLAGCEDCKIKSRIFLNPKNPFNPKTHYANGILKPKGIRSEENWKRFNDLGKRLTN